MKPFTTITLGVILCTLSVCLAVPSPPKEDDAAAAPSQKCLSLATSQGQFDLAEELLVKNPNYNKEVRPTLLNETTLPTKVSVDYFVGQVVHIDRTDGLLKVYLIFRQRWQDPRLAFHDQVSSCGEVKDLLVPQSMSDLMWSPDLFIPNELDVTRHSLFKPNMYFKISSHGTVLLSQRITLTLACPKLAIVPTKVSGEGEVSIDTTEEKECNLRVESYAYKADELELQWKKDDPIYVLPNIFVPGDLKLTSVIPQRCDSSSTKGTYSCIQGKFHFE